MQRIEPGSPKQPIREDVNHTAASSSETAGESQQNRRVI